MPYRCICLFALCFCLAAAVAMGASTTQEKLRGTQQQIEAQRQALEETKRREAAVQAELKRLDAKIRALEEQLAEAQKAWEATQGRKRDLEAQLAQIQSRHDQLARRASELTRVLWTATMRLKSLRAETWAEADRESTWLAAVLQELRQNRAQLAHEQAALSTQTEAVRAASAELEAQGKRLAAIKDDITRQRLAQVKEAEKLRAQRLEGEAQLGSLLAALEDLRRKAALEAAQKISAAKGKLPWPVQGRVINRFAPKASPPVTGIDIAAKDGDAVRAIAAGKVVHSDTLRGLGHVVIVYHGETYYSVYAFLADPSVEEGQAVTQGTALGRCGFSPKVKGPGVRFELRSGAQALNPLEWLAPL
ncbi:peptidase M24 [Thermodesulfomicrobium sp. WS]|uniref:murein hydrolase activator EnvC family protein n=1 Tax=Thermodesulfomicrobium sp. WS TaxID=3004129 RepID=UPI0024917825|nr:peptidoglycan DD-metalloendopeptidase family protein [Thermodesulfomicrobium sp. WS]BDV00798.1 peptidase M24 [Thermodesulfomicrobium sp. WS]